MESERNLTNMRTSFDYQTMQPGMNRLALAFASPTKQDAETKELQSLTNIDYLRARMGKANAEAQAAQERSGYLGNQSQFLSDQSGVAMPIVQKFLDAQKTGNYGMDVKPPSTGSFDDTEGARVPITEAPADLAPQIPKITRALQTLSATRASSASNPDQIAKAGGEYQGQQTLDDVIGKIRSQKLPALDEASALSQVSKPGNKIDLYDNGGGNMVYSRSRGNIVAESKKATAGPKPPSGYRVGPADADGNTTLEVIPGGPADKPAKPLPPSASKAIFENQQNLRRAEQALTLLEGGSVGGIQGDKSATGLKGLTPDFILQNIDSKGVDTRAAIANLGSLVIHDRSGAAVSVQEFPRLRPFIPQVTDSPESAAKKLRQFVAEYRNIQDEMTNFYTESGYHVPTETLINANGTKGTTNSAAAPKAPAAGAKVIRYDAQGNRL